MSKVISADERAQWRQAFAPLSDSKSLIIGRLLDALEQSERDRDTYRAIATEASETAGKRVRQLEQERDGIQVILDAFRTNDKLWQERYTKLEQECNALRAVAIHATETAREQAQILADKGVQVTRTDTAGQGEGE